MLKLLGNSYSPTATKRESAVAIGQRSSKLFLPKYHILNSGISPIAGNNRNGIGMSFFVVITSLLLKVQRYTFIFNYQTLW
jgi:hypothetical protein